MARIRPCVVLHFRLFRLGNCEGFEFQGLRTVGDLLGLSEILFFGHFWKFCNEAAGPSRRGSGGMMTFRVGVSMVLRLLCCQ